MKIILPCSSSIKIMSLNEWFDDLIVGRINIVDNFRFYQTLPIFSHVKFETVFIFGVMKKVFSGSCF